MLNNKTINVVILAVVGVIFLVIFSNLIIYLYLPEPTIIQSIPSPDSKYIAYVYESNGGATTGYIYHLSVLEKDKKIMKGNGNIYRSAFEFQVEWVDDNELQVNNSSSIKIYKQKENYKGIKVKYKYLKK